jgi:hypothetical protein
MVQQNIASLPTGGGLLRALLFSPQQYLEIHRQVQMSASGGTAKPFC